MSWWQAAVLGLVQGLAEFLPISSSGHLVLGEYVLGLDTAGAGDITFEVFVHFGTALSILTVYRARIGRILRDAVGALARPALWAEAFQAGRIERARGDELSYDAPEASGGPVPSLRLALYVLVTMVPTFIGYLLFEEPLEALFGDPRFVCGALIVTGVLLLLTRLRPDPDGMLSPGKAVLVGIAQTCALIPGISRSGSTICTAIYLNVDRKEAADFSFLMLLPVVLGATLLKTLDMLEVGMTTGVVPLAVGTLVAFVSGVFAIRAVQVLVQRQSLQYFAYYCFTVGGLGLVFI
ncbi:undecaprenyl-diphosphate phosphatase [Rubrivirga sp. S365]|uniref:undecaprenyl-diphosphate phosphatase n=1 Tax=Rubrivirga sp. S365 TaxID=3076080 RepID=UPI0028C8D4AC|nr:undecaprenyl-diphosphate phosphatase [Rubrivirga sp. S365]MDT7855916.1 undecaprenyl-diphosphate phosphatase [Rubrivirga sp. S365]